MVQRVSDELLHNRKSSGSGLLISSWPSQNWNFVFLTQTNTFIFFHFYGDLSKVLLAIMNCAMINAPGESWMKYNSKIFRF